MLNVILEDLTFNDKFQTFFTDENFTPEDGKVYQTLGIIGCQSSGKSTLLNHVFNTNFEIMSDDKGRAQTTKGIWVGINKEFKVVIFDVEGTDSKERGDERFKFEQCSSLFTLAMSDVLMINMWTNDIGRYTASNYGILKVVFEQNLKLFQQESEKKIIIVLRDFDSSVDDLSKLKESIMNDMKQIWEEIPKPEAFKDKPCSEFFRFEFLTLAHKFYKEKEFNEGINLIKQRLKREKDDNRTGDNPDSIFNLVNYDKNVPIDGFYKYSLDIWTSILNNKDLNIPGQKEMLARFKCDEIKLMALNAVDEKINDLDLASSSEILNDFNERVNAILKEALDNYDPLAKNYLPHIYQDVRKTLQTELANKLYSSFSNQLKRLIPKYQKEFRNEFEQQLRQNENFMEVSEKLKKKYVEKLGEELGKLKVFNDWDTGKDSEVIFNEIIENQRNICLEEKKEKLIEQFIELIEETIVNKFELVTNNFWVEFQQEIFLLVSQNLLAQKERLAQIYKITDEEYINFVDDCENEIYSKIRTLFFNELPGFPNTQIDNFKKDFWYNDGIPKVWNTVSVSDINLAFQTNSSKYKDSFEILRKLRVIKNPLKMCDYGQKPKEEIETFEKETIEQIINDPFTEFETLLDDDTLQKYIVKYEEGIKDIYDEAMRRHENIISTRIPLWAWALLIYISYDDIWKMITGHWLLMLLLASGIFALFRVLNMVGLGNAPQMLFNTIQNQLKMLTNKNKIN
jgi:hemerythrin-like domain-containing protein